MRVAQIIEQKLTAALEPAQIEVIDESHLHEGHAGAREGGESHFRVTIVADAFTDLNRVARQRKVYEVLADELAGPIHALALSTMTPTEADSRA
ncbi:MAG: BolA family transcriptional regulator [Rhodospirillaceae bacterium]|nr:BolA family transcriptional regulator [Rhodospirillaceae bacterium]HAA92467.1 BolA family transcriptional regulator [Rhodospirillaceae bacterium]|tara:strand:- start:259 stop:540 length:282 start_codon:yes stop_codon:yes gene_type:complete